MISISDPELQIRVQHWGDDQHILLTFLVLGGGMILGFLVWASFLCNFSPNFLITFFLLARLFFSHFLLKLLNP